MIKSTSEWVGGGRGEGGVMEFIGTLDYVEIPPSEWTLAAV